MFSRLIRMLTPSAVALFSASQAPAESAAPITLVTLGDSLITGDGIDPPDQFSAVLEGMLIGSGENVKVQDQGFRHSSQNGVNWIEMAEGIQFLSSPANTAAIVELGSNDCINENTLEQTRDNLDAIFAAFTDVNIPVLVVGTSPHEGCGTEYGDAYLQMFVDLAAKHGNLLYNDFMTGLHGHPELIQADGEHPNAQGELIVVENILPSVIALLRRVEP